MTGNSTMSNIEHRYGIAGNAAGKAALEYGAGRKATDAFVLSRIARAIVDALDADDRGAVEALAEAVAAARTFNRGGMTWLEYDALLARLEHDHLGGQ